MPFKQNYARHKMLNRRQLLQLAGVGCGALLGGTLHSARALLSEEAKQRMIKAIPGEQGRCFEKAGFIGYHVTSQPAGSPTFSYLQAMWSRVHERSHGWLQVVVLPNSGKLPSADTEAVLATASGRYDAITVAGPAIDAITPQTIPLQALAFAYKNSNAAKAIVNTPIYAACMRDAALVNNLHCLDGLLNAGMRQMTTIRDYPLRSTKDFEGLVLRIPPGPIYSEQLEPLGIKTVMTPISSVLTLLQKRAVMGQENPVNYAVLMRFYKACKYLNETNHFWSGFNTLINADTWRQWPTTIQQIVQDEYTSIIDPQWLAVETSNHEATSFCLANGMELIKTDLTDVRQKIKNIQLQIIQRLDMRLQPIARRLIESQV